MSPIFGGRIYSAYRVQSALGEDVAGTGCEASTPWPLYPQTTSPDLVTPVGQVNAFHILSRGSIARPTNPRELGFQDMLKSFTEDLSSMYSSVHLGNNKALPDQKVSWGIRQSRDLGTLCPQVLGHPSKKLYTWKVWFQGAARQTWVQSQFYLLASCVNSSNLLDWPKLQFSFCKLGEVLLIGLHPEKRTCSHQRRWGSKQGWKKAKQGTISQPDALRHSGGCYTSVYPNSCKGAGLLCSCTSYSLAKGNGGSKGQALGLSVLWARQPQEPSGRSLTRGPRIWVEDIWHLYMKSSPLITVPSGRTSIFIFMANKTNPENQNKLPTVTQLKSNEARIRMQLCLGSKGYSFHLSFRGCPGRWYGRACLFSAQYILGINLPNLNNTYLNFPCNYGWPIRVNEIIVSGSFKWSRFHQKVLFLSFPHPPST